MQLLFGFSSPLLTILEPGATLIVLASGRWKPSKLEVALVQNAIAIGLNVTAGTRA
jgi:hypothetical protein